MSIEHNLSEQEFQLYRELIYNSCGLNFTDSKKQLLASRLKRRMIALDLQTFRAYREYVTTPQNAEEYAKMLNEITTNKTDFFRESEHFEFLKHNVYPKLAKQAQIKAWSAACSNGSEPYTIAMTMLDFLGSSVGKDIKILATDLSTKVLSEAEQGVYSLDFLEPVPKPLLKKYVLKGENQWAGFGMMQDELKKIIHFKQINLVEPFPIKSKFDFIFCRNVMIYFDEKTREELINKLYHYLKPGAYFFIGNAESLTGLKHHFKYVQPSIYQKIKEKV